MFSKIAPRYDSMNRIMSLGRDLSWRRRAVRLAEFKVGSRILDLGAGSGDMAEAVRNQVKNSAIVGFDYCLELLQIAKSKLINHGVEWILGDGRFISFRDKSFDGVVAAFSIRNMPDLTVVFSEIHRVLKPGGKVVVLDMVKPVGFFFSAIFKFFFIYIIPLLGKLMGSHPDAYTYLLPSIENFYTANQLTDTLSNNGFTILKTKNLMLRTVSICIGQKE